jgi:hypothetical protein
MNKVFKFTVEIVLNSECIQDRDLASSAIYGMYEKVSEFSRYAEFLGQEGLRDGANVAADNIQIIYDLYYKIYLVLDEYALKHFLSALTFDPNFGIRAVAKYLLREVRPSVIDLEVVAVHNTLKNIFEAARDQLIRDLLSEDSHLKENLRSWTHGGAHFNELPCDFVLPIESAHLN